MARKKRGAHGGHGWFVTFADLMSLLMSFFVMLTAFSTQDSKKLQAVAGSMREAFGNQRNPRYAGIVESDGIPTRTKLKNVRIAAPEEGSDFTVPNMNDGAKDGPFVNAFDARFGQAVASLRQALAEMPEIAEISKNIVLEETRQGLNISIVDQDGRSMFAEGSTTPFERTRRALQAMAPALRRMPNRVEITGHTAASRFNPRAGLVGLGALLGPRLGGARNSRNERVARQPLLRRDRQIGLGAGVSRQSVSRRQSSRDDFADARNCARPGQRQALGILEQQRGWRMRRRSIDESERGRPCLSEKASPSCSGI